MEEIWTNLYWWRVKHFRILELSTRGDTSTTGSTRRGKHLKVQYTPSGSFSYNVRTHTSFSKKLGHAKHMFIAIACASINVLRERNRPLSVMNGRDSAKYLRIIQPWKSSTRWRIGRWVSCLVGQSREGGWPLQNNNCVLQNDKESYSKFKLNCR